MGNEILQSKMIFKTSIITQYKGTGINSIDAIKVGNQSAYKTLLNGEKHEFISTTKFGEDVPAMLNPWTPIILTEEWAQSFAKAVNDIPKPVFIPGHTSSGLNEKERAIPDGYITGAMVKDSMLYLRNSLPDGATENQKALIEQTMREITAGMLSTSTEDVISYKIEVNPDNQFDETYFAIESIKGQGNALVEADQTGSEAKIILTSFKAGNSHDEKQGEEQMGKETVTNTEMFTLLKNQLGSGHLALKDVASGLGIEVMTLKQKEALKRLNDAESKIGPIDEFVVKMKTDQDATFVALKDAKIKEIFKTKELIEIAVSLFMLKEGGIKEIDTEVTRLTDLAVFKTLQGNIAGSISFKPTGTSTEEISLNNGAAEPMEG